MKETALQRNLNRFNAKNRQQFFINIDWLQMHVKAKFGKFEAFETPYFKVERTGQSKVFRNIFSITYKKHNRVMATLAFDALEQILPAGHGIIKVDNFYLYHFSARLRPGVEWLLRRLQLDFVGITRLDIAFDFNSFNNRREPENFIKAFLNNRICKLKKSKFRVAGKHLDKNRFNYIAFGSKTSAVNYKLYNKSEEMRDVVHKSHIWESWKRTNLDLTKDVWRIEFTINSNTNILLNEWNDIKFHSMETLNIENYSGLFKYLFDTYFQFRFYEPAKHRKDRMKPVDLLSFPAEFSRVALKKVNPQIKDVSRSTKIFIKKLESHQNELRGRDDDFCFDAREMISKLISVYQLQNWAEKKGIAFEPMNYVDDLNEAI